MHPKGEEFNGQSMCSAALGLILRGSRGVKALTSVKWERFNGLPMLGYTCRRGACGA